VARIEQLSDAELLRIATGGSAAGASAPETSGQKLLTIG
jgi:hypothetical protein